MNTDLIREMTLQARDLLVAEAWQQFESIYGLRPDGTFEDAALLPAIRSLEEVRETRDRLEKFLADEADAGLKGKEAVEKLVKETAFTNLNRLVAFKMLEARKLIRGTIDRYHDSNAFKLYLADDPHTADLALYQAGTMPQNPFGEGPRDIAYRNFLLWQTAQLAMELRVLFNSVSLASCLFPRPRALRDLLALLNDARIEPAWQPGHEETIGWVYQFFNEQEKADVFDRLYKQKQKIRREDIPAATQIFTPRWIVRFLVHNTLGRLWLQMHPESRLAADLDYLVPLAGELPAVTTKPVGEITLLDPACGTMHFGLVAFDLLVEMYREELEHTGEPGWFPEPSVRSEDEIPAAIIRHNLHGVDIDLRAVQLSALTLYLKAKTLNPNAQLDESRLACADIHMLDGERLQEFLKAAGIDRPIYGRILAALYERLRHADQLGSLLRPDEEVRALIEKERQRFDREGRTPDMFGWSETQFETEAGREEFWEIIEAQINQALDHFAREQAAKGRDQSFFVGETTKGLRLLEILGQRYDVIVANPPYMTNRNMNAVIGDHLKKSFPAGKRDLYAAFIQRCSELLADDGRMGLISQQSFMFISSYGGLRNVLRERVAIETMCHVGPRAFAEVTGEKVNTTIFIMRHEKVDAQRDEAVGAYFRLVKEPDAEAKRTRFQQALAALRDGRADATIHHYRQGDFDAISGAPWVYWITPTLRELFIKLPKLLQIAQPRQGLATADNFRFLRCWWEVGIRSVCFGCASQRECESRSEKWLPYMKGGSFQRWYGNQEYCINYGQNGYELKAWADPLYGNSGWSRIIKSPDFYFRRGVTWTDLTPGRFSARLSPGGFVFDVSGSSVFPDDIATVLGIMISRFAQYALKLINPTAHVQVGDLARLPFPNESSDKLRDLVERAIALAKTDSEEDETTFDFIAPAWRGSLEATQTFLNERHSQLEAIEREVDEEVYTLYGISETDRRAIEEELATAARNQLCEESPDQEESSATDDVDVSGNDKLAAADSAQRIAFQHISYAVGIVMGRFQPGVDDALGSGDFAPGVGPRLGQLADADGIATLDEAHEDDLARKVERALELMLGEAGATEVLSVALNDSGSGTEMLPRLRHYLEADFFKQHAQRYRKRPVYWLLQSPKKNHSLLLFHERLTRDSLALVRGTRYLGAKINLLSEHIREVRLAITSAEGSQKKLLERQLDSLDTSLIDLENFEQAIGRVMDTRNERGHTVGWTLEIDDGIVLNMAPLHELLPSWKAEPKKYWDALKAGKYDWSATAMRYWPDRVLAKCKTNRSYAIAHKREDLYEAD